MSNAQGNILLTAQIACGTSAGALGVIIDVGDWGAYTAADRDLGRCVVVIWKVQSGDVHILRWRIDTAIIEICKDISNMEGFVGSTHIARLRREAPGRRLLMCGTSSRNLVSLDPPCHTSSVSLCPREALESMKLWGKTPRKLGMASCMLEAIQLPVMEMRMGLHGRL